jgi:hypothetical protein
VGTAKLKNVNKYRKMRLQKVLNSIQIKKIKLYFQINWICKI